MTHVGFLFNCSMRTNPMVRLSPTVINRVLLIDAELRQYGSRIFYYSPKRIRPAGQKVPGYQIENQTFVPVELPVPRVNGNWTYSTRRLIEQGMGYRDLVEWSEKNGVGIYVPLTFSELVGNKYDAYRVVRGYRHDIHPETAPYRQSLQQLRFFAERFELLFLKPRAGNKGDGILTWRREPDGFTLTVYKRGKQKRHSVASLADAHELIKALTGGTRRYLIQEGVDTLRYQGSVFDVRVVMLHDGRDWSWLHEARVSPSGSDLSNVSQGGISLDTEELLGELFSKEDVARQLAALRSEAFGLAAYLDRLHPNELMEVAFDFVIDKEGSPRLVEINTKPGLVSVGFLTSFMNMKPGQEKLFERWVYPHTSALARFLQSKVDAL